MEPMRDPTYNMGQDGNWSTVWSIVYIVGGALFIIAIHLYDYFYHVKGKHPRVIPSYKGVQEYTWKKEKASLSVVVDQKLNAPDTSAGVSSIKEGVDAPVNESKDEPLPLNQTEDK